MPTITDKIKEIEAEMARTQKNKATEGHLGMLKAKIAKLRAQLLEPAAGGGGGGDGFAVAKAGDARVALIGFPSVGKSTLLNRLTGTKSQAAAYEFTTLTCIPGNIYYKGTKIQMLDLPGIIEGAASGKGRGRQVVAVAKSADLILMVLDALKESEQNHRAILERELEAVGIRLNQEPPDITYRKKMTGGVKFTTTVRLTKLGADPEKTVKRILSEYRVHNAEVLFRGDYTADQLIDVIMENRRYIRCLYVYNKIDAVTMEDVDRLARHPHSTVTAVRMGLNIDRLLAMMWRYLDLCRIYTKRKGQAPDFGEPVVLTEGRGGRSVEDFCRQIHTDMIRDFNYAQVWGRSGKHCPQTVGLAHVLEDEDVVQVVVKTAKQQQEDKNFGDRAQAHFDKMKKRKEKKKLKT